MTQGVSKRNFVLDFNLDI